MSKGICGYGRYDDDPNCVGCPRARSDMTPCIARDGHLLESTETNIVPKERYTSREFFDLEMEKLWPHVWQMACREEEIPKVGDYFEYLIGDLQCFQAIDIIDFLPQLRVCIVQGRQAVHKFRTRITCH